MYYSVNILSREEESVVKVFAINAEKVNVEYRVFDAIIKDCSFYFVQTHRFASRKKLEIGIRKRYPEIQIERVKTFEALIKRVYEHKFYKTIKVYETLYDTKEYHCDLSKFGLEIGDFFIGGPYSDVNQKYLFFKIFDDNTPFNINYENLAKIMSDELGYPVIVGRNNWLYIRNVHERSYIQSVDGKVTLTIVREEQVECGEKEVLITK